MSRIGNRILPIPEGVEVKWENNIFHAKGTKGELSHKFNNVISIVIEDNTVKTIRPNDLKFSKQMHGTMNSILSSMIEGVQKGFKKELEIIGVGYKAELKGDTLVLHLGFSHLINYKIPDSVKLTLPKPTIIHVEGIDKQLVGEVAANIRNYRKPEPYKGKGIRYVGEQVIRKEGKAAGK